MGNSIEFNLILGEIRGFSLHCRDHLFTLLFQSKKRLRVRVLKDARVLPSAIIRQLFSVVNPCFARNFNKLAECIGI